MNHVCVRRLYVLCPFVVFGVTAYSRCLPLTLIAFTILPQRDQE